MQQNHSDTLFETELNKIAILMESNFLTAEPNFSAVAVAVTTQLDRLGDRLIDNRNPLILNMVANLTKIAVSVKDCVALGDALLFRVAGEIDAPNNFLADSFGQWLEGLIAQPELTPTHKRQIHIGLFDIATIIAKDDLPINHGLLQMFEAIDTFAQKSGSVVRLTPQLPQWLQAANSSAVPKP